MCVSGPTKTILHIGTIGFTLAYHPGIKWCMKETSELYNNEIIKLSGSHNKIWQLLLTKICILPMPKVVFYHRLLSKVL
jgi:hypothetical protein